MNNITAADNVSSKVRQNIDVFKEIVIKLNLAETFQTVINTSSLFHLQLDSASQENATNDTTSIDTEHHESFTDLLDAFVKPAIVIAVILTLLLVFYILMKIKF